MPSSLRGLRFLLGLGAIVLVRPAAAAPGPVVAKSAAPRSCARAAKVSGAVELDGTCVYENFVIEESNTTLDCKGATIGGAAGGSAKGISIRGDIENVVVENCWLEGTDGITIAPPERAPDETDDALRLRSPRNVVVRHVSVSDSRGSGVFVGPVVAGARIEDSIIERADSAGIYLEYATRNIAVRGNVIRENGFTAKGIARTEWARREGIAVDSSAENVIEDNVFEDNAFGGVFLYKNCWEDSHVSAKSLPRTQHSEKNVIRGNTFRDMPFGVWIAARQARDLGAWDCGDATPYPNPLSLAEAFPPGYPTFRSTYPARYDVNLEYLGALWGGRPVPNADYSTTRTAVYAWLDFAEDNVVADNRFEKIAMAGVRVEDDRAEITGNTFVGDFDYVYVGTTFRTHWLQHPVRGTVIRGNRFEQAAAAGKTAFEQNLALVPGEHEGTIVEDNGVSAPEAEPAAAPSARPGDEVAVPAAPPTVNAVPAGGEPQANGGGGCAVSLPSPQDPSGSDAFAIAMLLALVGAETRRRVLC